MFQGWGAARENAWYWVVEGMRDETSRRPASLDTRVCDTRCVNTSKLGGS